MRIEGRLERWTCWYLMVPWLMFAWGWLRTPVAFALTVVLVLLAVRQNAWLKTDREAVALDWFAWAAVLAAAAFWTWTATTVNRLDPASSWLLDQGILADLSARPWPLGYLVKDVQRVHPFVGDLGFFLPSAFVGDVFGWTGGHAFHVVWATIGLGLAFLWILKSVRGSALSGLLVFCLAGGLDWIGNALVGTSFLDGRLDWEQWTGVWTYFSNASLLVSVPGAAVAGWIGVASYLNAKQNQDRPQNVVLIWVLTLLWSRWVFLGLLPFMLSDIFKRRSRYAAEPAQDFLGLVFVALMGGMYFFSNPAAFKPDWFFRDHNLFEYWPRLLLFYGLEFGFLLVFLRPSGSSESVADQVDRRIALGILLAAPLVLGHDTRPFMALLAIPALALLWMESVKFFHCQPPSGMRKAWCLVAFLGAFPALGWMVRSVSAFDLNPLSLQDVQTELQDVAWPPRCYLGDANSFFNRILARDINVNQMAKKEVAIAGEGALLQLEAERYENQTRHDFHQACPWASGGSIVDNGFGAQNGDRLIYTFDLNASTENVQIAGLVSSESDGAALRILIDGREVGTWVCPNTGDWWAFRPVSVFAGQISAGPRTLEIVSNGINANIDKIWVSKTQSQRIHIEAESNANLTRLDHRQSIPWASAGVIVDNDFGGDKSDQLEYRFFWSQAAKGFIKVSYATVRLDAELEVFIDDKPAALMTFPKTGGWGDFHWMMGSLGPVGEGPHTLRLKSNGVNINLDVIVLEGEIPS